MSGNPLPSIEKFVFVSVGPMFLVLPNGLCVVFSSKEFGSQYRGSIRSVDYLILEGHKEWLAY